MTSLPAEIVYGTSTSPAAWRGRARRRTARELTTAADQREAAS
jgi:hypothetical protein